MLFPILYHDVIQPSWQNCRTLLNLDVIISVGYRVKSARGVLFRKWATQTLKQHLVQGYTLNQQRFEENALTLEKALDLVRKTARSPELNTDAGRGLVEIVSRATPGRRSV